MIACIFVLSFFSIDTNNYYSNVKHCYIILYSSDIRSDESLVVSTIIIHSVFTVF